MSTGEQTDQEDRDSCKRCGSYLTVTGYCASEICPFDSHKQDCEAGWAGHEERDPHPNDDLAGPECTCRT